MANYTSSFVLTQTVNNCDSYNGAGASKRLRRGTKENKNDLKKKAREKENNRLIDMTSAACENRKMLRRDGPSDSLNYRELSRVKLDKARGERIYISFLPPPLHYIIVPIVFIGLYTYIYIHIP